MTPASPAPRFLIFDLDGTLVDSLTDLTTALNLLRADLGLSPLTPTAVRSMVGDGATRLVQRGLDAVPYEPRYLQRFLTLYENHLLDTTRCYQGIVDLLKRYSPQQLAIVTNKPYDLTVKILAGLELTPCFAAVVGGDSTPDKKPHPGPLLAALKLLGAPPSQAVMIGDHHTDLRAARAAGTASCFCAYGFGHRDGLAGDYQAATTADLLDLFTGNSL